MADCTTARGYGRGPYGARRYGGWPALDRPYGVGAYGTGPYSRYAQTVFCMAGSSGVMFDTTLPSPAIVMQPEAPTGIVFDAWSPCFGIMWNAEALTGIVFQADASLRLSWDAWAPCATGGWLTPTPCSGGAWQAPGVCGTGTWTVTRYP